MLSIIMRTCTSKWAAWTPRWIYWKKWWGPRRFKSKVATLISSGWISRSSDSRKRMTCASKWSTKWPTTYSWARKSIPACSAGSRTCRSWENLIALSSPTTQRTSSGATTSPSCRRSAEAWTGLTAPTLSRTLSVSRQSIWSRAIKWTRWKSARDTLAMISAIVWSISGLRARTCAKLA